MAGADALERDPTHHLVRAAGIKQRPTAHLLTHNSFNASLADDEHLFRFSCAGDECDVSLYGDAAHRRIQRENRSVGEFSTTRLPKRRSAWIGVFCLAGGLERHEQKEGEHDPVKAMSL